RLAKKGREGNSYELPSVYFVAVLGFRLDKTNLEKYYYSAKIVDEFDNEMLYPKLSYKMLVLPNFNKPREASPTLLDQWMYLMKHCHEMSQLVNYWDKRIFSRILEIGELANLTPAEKMAYISSVDRKRDYNNTLAFAKQEAKAEGLQQGKAEGLQQGKAEGLQQGKAEGAEQKSYEVVRNLLISNQFTVGEITGFATVTEEFVEEVRAGLSDKK